MDRLEEETLHQMSNLLSQLSPSHPSMVLMLSSIGLDVVAKAVQELKSESSSGTSGYTLFYGCSYFRLI